MIGTMMREHIAQALGARKEARRYMRMGSLIGWRVHMHAARDHMKLARSYRAA
jgi:hypothetical protein